jgi:dihydrodipicolinate synthase/N-acetylneuraminate lyase
VSHVNKFRSSRASEDPFMSAAFEGVFSALVTPMTPAEAIDHHGLASLVEFLIVEGGGKYTQFVKAACALAGRPVGPPRRPLLPARPEEIEKLRDALSSLEGTPCKP